jgi:hypothetical protein
MIRGLDDKRRLLRFFAAKNHRNLVLRVVDILEMRNDRQDYLIRAVERLHGPLPAPEPAGDGWRKKWLLRKAPTGWVLLDIDTLLEPLELAQVEELQQVLHEYRAVRLEKGEPNRVDDCEKCRGTGRVAGNICKTCDGDGQIITFLEMSPEEIEMAGAS